jgi:hypothetical protein
MKRVCLLAVGALAALSYVAAPSRVRSVEHESAQSGGSTPANAPDGPLQVLAGNVSEIDHSNGLLTLASPAGHAKLHFPPASLVAVRNGDAITVQYAFARGPLGEQLAYSSPAGLGQHRMIGTVTQVDHTSGWIQVQTEPGTLRLPFPAKVVRQLKAGDQVSIDLAFDRWIPPRRS